MAACWGKVIRRGTVTLNVGEHWDSCSMPKNRCPPSPGIGLPLTHLLRELWLEQAIEIVMRVKDNCKHCVSGEALRFEKSHLPLFLTPRVKDWHGLIPPAFIDSLNIVSSSHANLFCFPPIQIFPSLFLSNPLVCVPFPLGSVITQWKLSYLIKKKKTLLMWQVSQRTYVFISF